MLEIYKISKKDIVVIQNTFCFILLEFCLLKICYVVLHYTWGVCHHAYAKDAPFAYLCNFYCFQ
jgi:hypothetical protein